MIPCTWQWSGSGTPFAVVVPLGFHLASVICVGVTGKLPRFAIFAHAVAGSGRLFCTKLAPKLIRDAPITRLPRAEIGRRRKYRRRGEGSLVNPRLDALMVPIICSFRYWMAAYKNDLGISLFQSARTCLIFFSND